MKRIVLLAVVGLLLAQAAGSRFSAAPVENPSQSTVGGTTLPDKLVFDDSEREPKFSKFAGYDQDMGRVPFNHAAHVTPLACVACHHTNGRSLTATHDQASEAVPKCTTCHTDQPFAPSPIEGTNESVRFKGKPAIEAKLAFMGRDKSDSPAKLSGCISCHRALGAQFPKAAKVVACQSCHGRA